MSVETPNKWLTVKAESNAAVMVISGRIGKDWFDNSGTSSKEFRDELEKIPAGMRIKVRINSEGGSIQDGLEIYNALQSRRNDVTCYVDGYAVSIASIIALAGSKTISPKSSVWMIHEPWCTCQGNADDMLRSAEMLDKHGDVLASIYAEETGKSKRAAREAMRTETWFTGSEAAEWGLADELVDDAVALAALDPKQFHNIPVAILAQISGDTNGAKPNNTLRSAEGQGQQPATETPETLSPVLENGEQSTQPLAGPAQAENKMENTNAPAVADTTALINALQQQLASEKRARVRSLVAQKAENKIPNDSIDWWVDRACADETGTLAQIDKLPVAQVGGDSVGRVSVVNEGEVDRITRLSTPGERYNALKRDWDNIIADCFARDARGEKARVFNRYQPTPVGGFGMPQNANTLSATITTSFLMDGFVTILQHRWAPLMCFTRDFSTDPYKPLATGVLKYVDATTAAQTNATNFESGNGDTIDPVSVTMAQYTKNFAVTNAELNSGLRMENLLTINAAGMADKVISVATAPITAANFGTTAGTTGAADPLISSADAFAFSDLAKLWGGLKKSPVKNVLLDGEYLARVINSPTFYQVAGNQPGGGWKAFGWDYIALNTNWTGAGSNIRGFACNPQAITVVAGLPMNPPDGIPGNTLQIATATVPDVGITIANYSWFSLSTRTAWQSFDIMLGAAATDKTAGILIKSQ